MLEPVLLWIISQAILYCDHKKLDIEITRTIDERIDGVSTSDTHSEGRAIDIGLHGWSKFDTEDFMFFMNGRFSPDFGAFSNSDGKPRLIPDVNHGTAPHFHLQIRKGLSMVDVWNYMNKHNKE